jgi:predicted alpha/beta superfamily hydrolase
MKLIQNSLLFICLITKLHAQQVKPVAVIAQSPFLLGTSVKLQSGTLGEARTLNIYLPEGYSKDSAKPYPVIYLLDGSADEDFIHIAGLVQFLTMIQRMPPSILVGIGNTDRRRDFTFAPTPKAEPYPNDWKYMPTAGGSARFISFIEKEVQPYIQNNYHTSGGKTIIGQSLGGLLAAEILVRKPALFTDYIIVSPSFWYNKESLLSESTERIAACESPVKVYLSRGNEGKEMEADDVRFTENLRRLEGPRFKVYLVPMPEENHLTILHRSVYRGLELLNKKS